MTSLRQMMIRLVLVEGSDGLDCRERINCSIALGMGEMSQTQQIWSSWVPLRSVEMWGREHVWAETMKKLINAPYVFMEIISQAIYKSVLRLGQRWGKLGLLEYADMMVCFSWIGLIPVVYGCRIPSGC